jgi:transcriptional regulator with XRE-family HTH domain
MELSRAVRLMRTASGMKQKDVARKVGVTPNYLSLVENGRREPSVSLLKGLARVLGVPIGLFFLWEEADLGPSKKGITQLRGLLARLEAMYLIGKRSSA